MKYDVAVETAQAELVAAVRATVPISGVARAWKPALDQVWAFLKTNAKLAPGHNLFLYHHPERRNEAMNRGWGTRNSSVSQLLQVERAGIPPLAADPERIAAVLEADKQK